MRLEVYTFKKYLTFKFKNFSEEKKIEDLQDSFNCSVSTEKDEVNSIIIHKNNKETFYYSENEITTTSLLESENSDNLPEYPINTNGK